jgi:hypothetical protein
VEEPQGSRVLAARRDAVYDLTEQPPLVQATYTKYLSVVCRKRSAYDLDLGSKGAPSPVRMPNKRERASPSPIQYLLHTKAYHSQDDLTSRPDVQGTGMSSPKAGEATASASPSELDAILENTAIGGQPAQGTSTSPEPGASEDAGSAGKGASPTGGMSKAEARRLKIMARARENAVKVVSAKGDR